MGVGHHEPHHRPCALISVPYQCTCRAVDLITRAYTDHSDSDVSFALRIFFDILQGLDDHIRHLVVHCSVHYVGPSSVGE